MTKPISHFLFLALAPALLLTGCSSAPQKKPLSEHERARLLLDVGNGSLVEGDPTGALQALFSAEALEPNMPELHNSLALAYYAKGNINEALKEAQTSVKLAPDYADALNTLGKIYIDLGQYGEGVAPLTKAAENPLYRDVYKSLTNLGILYYREGDLEKASRYFRKSIDVNRDASCIAYYYEGHLSLRAGNYPDAISNYKQATLKACGGFADAHLAIAITYEREKRYDLARRSFLNVQQRFPDSKAADEAVHYLKGIP